MIYIISILIMFFILFLLTLVFLNQKNNITNYEIKIEEAIENINIGQEKQITLLTKISKKTNQECETKILSNLPKIKNKELNIFELEKELYKLNKELNEFIEENEKKIKDEEKKLLNLLKINSIELKSIEKYYNEQANKYNNTIKKFTYLFIKIITHLKKKELFIFEKEVEFEILKNH